MVPSEALFIAQIVLLLLTGRLLGSPEDAILRQARLGHYNLIVVGVGRPAGETLFLGTVAAAVLEHSECLSFSHQVDAPAARLRSAALRLRFQTG
jgi:hypothetical protein